MADFQAAVTALESLQGEDVAVTVEGTNVAVTVQYRDETVGFEREKASYTFNVSFDDGSGEYKITHAQTATESGPGGFGMEKKFGSGKNVSMSKSISFGGGESSSSTFNSKTWEDQITERVEAAGWAKKKGFLGKLFGR